MLAATWKFLRQIVPPVIATLIAAVLIAGFNRAFSTHLTQPRMAALHAETNSESAPPRAAPVVATADLLTEPVVDRLGDKGGMREAAKDHQALKLAEAAPPAPVRRPERVAEIRPEPRPAEAYLAAPLAAPPVATPPVIAAPVAVAPPPVVLAPPPVAVTAPPVVVGAPAVKQEAILAEQPVVTVPDRPRPLPATPLEEPAPPQNPIGAIVNTLKPSSLFARAREFGEKIEAAGNEILPNIRQ